MRAKGWLPWFARKCVKAEVMLLNFTVSSTKRPSVQRQLAGQQIKVFVNPFTVEINEVEKRLHIELVTLQCNFLFKDRFKQLSLQESCLQESCLKRERESFYMRC